MDRVGWVGLLVIEVGDGVKVELFLTLSGLTIKIRKRNKVIIVLLSRRFDKL